MATRKSHAAQTELPGAANSELVLSKERENTNYREDMLSGIRDRILNQHQQFVGTVIEGVFRAVDCGLMLLDVKAMMPHGTWKKWLFENFAVETGLSDRTALRYMNIAQTFKSFLSRGGYRDIDEATGQLRVTRERIQEFHWDQTQSAATTIEVVRDPNDWQTPDHVIDAVRGVLGTIECDPCASLTGSASIADVQYSKNEDGLSASNPWPGTALIAPGHVGDMTAWCVKTLHELENGNLSEAILCLPETTLSLMPQLLLFPIAVSISPMVVTFDSGIKSSRKPLPTRSLFIYVTRAPKTELFASAFRDTGVVFARVTWESQASLLSLPRLHQS